MEEKPVRKSNGLAFASLCLGLAGFILSPWIFILSRVFHDSKNLGTPPDWLWLELIFLTGPIIGLEGIILGFVHAIKRKGGKWLSIPGIILGILGVVSWCLLLIYGMFFSD